MSTLDCWKHTHTVHIKCSINYVECQSGKEPIKEWGESFKWTHQQLLVKFTGCFVAICPHTSRTHWSQCWHRKNLKQKTGIWKIPPDCLPIVLSVRKTYQNSIPNPHCLHFFNCYTMLLTTSLHILEATLTRQQLALLTCSLFLPQMENVEAKTCKTEICVRRQICVCSSMFLLAGGVIISPNAPSNTPHPNPSKNIIR